MDPPPSPIASGVRLPIVAGVGLAVSLVVVGAVVLAWPEPPITLEGAWNVTDFEWIPSAAGLTNNVSLQGGRMVFVPDPACDAPPCDLVVTEGPPLLVGVVMEPGAGGSEYLGKGANVVPTCDGTKAPQELTDGSLTVTRGADDALQFTITSTLTGPFDGCEPFTLTYTATATRG